MQFIDTASAIKHAMGDMTTVDLAKATGIDRSQLSRIVCGQVQPSREQVLKISRATGACIRSTITVEYGFRAWALELESIKAAEDAGILPEGTHETARDTAEKTFKKARKRVDTND